MSWRLLDRRRVHTLYSEVTLKGECRPMDELGKGGGVVGHRHTLADQAPPVATIASLYRLLHKAFHVKPHIVERCT